VTEREEERSRRRKWEGERHLQGTQTGHCRQQHSRLPRLFYSLVVVDSMTDEREVRVVARRRRRSSVVGRQVCENKQPLTPCPVLQQLVVVGGDREEMCDGGGGGGIRVMVAIVGGRRERWGVGGGEGG
jgi:hypothetical protein